MRVVLFAHPRFNTCRHNIMAHGFATMRSATQVAIAAALMAPASASTDAWK
jgi:hypothetical protein